MEEIQTKDVVPETKEAKPQRTVSDVIVAVESKLDTLIKIFTQLNFNTSLVLDRSNKIYNILDKLDKQLLDEEIPVLSDKKIVNSPENPITIADKNEGVRRTARSEAYVNQQLTQPVLTHSEQNNVIIEKNKVPLNETGKKVPVSQRVVDQTGKDLYMANVQVSSQEGKEVLKTKTNAVGKWQGYLSPGSYNVKIEKTDAASKNKTEISQNINVPSINTTHVLPVVIVKK